MTLSYKHTKYAAYIGYITQAIVNNLMPLLFVSFQREFSLSLDKISLLITMNFGVQIVTDLVAAKYTDRIGYRAAAVAAHVLAVIGLTGMSYLPFIISPFAGLCICSAVNAVGGGLTEVIISPIIEALPGDEKSSAMSLLHSFYCWGQVAVVLLSTLYFVTAGISAWRFLPFIWALVPFFNIFLFIKVPIRTLNEDGEDIPLSKLFGKKIFWLFLLLMICAGASELAMSQWASLFAEEGLKVSKTVGDLLGPCAFAVLMGTARTFYGLKGAKMNLKKTIAASGLLCAASYMLAVFAPHPAISLAGCALCGLSVGIMWPGTFSIAAKCYPSGGTGMFAILALAGDVGCSAGPTLAGFVADGTGDLKKGLLAAAVFPVIMTAGIPALKVNKEEHND
ncbi:MAG: MFS transporter [Ruminococcus sp.]|nr:MFS transporter [Ruminococcus sp.]